jgi:hypothetical protein
MPSEAKTVKFDFMEVWWRDADASAGAEGWGGAGTQGWPLLEKGYRYADEC